MAFGDDNYDYSFYEAPQQGLDSSYLDAYPDYGYVPQIPDVAPEYAYNPYAQDYSYDVAPTPQLPPESMYAPAPQPEATPWYEQAAKGLTDYAAKNPKDVLGMLAGGGMGLYGLLRGTEKAQAPDLTAQRQATDALMAQLTASKQLNADAANRIQQMLAGNYGDYGDEAAVRQQDNQKLQELLTAGPSAMTPADEAQLAQIDADYAARGLLGSSLHQRARSQAQEEIKNNQQQRYLQQIQGLRDLGTAKSNAQQGVFQNVGGLYNQNQNTQVQGRASLADAGVKSADRKSTRLNSSHVEISYAVFCLKK